MLWLGLSVSLWLSVSFIQRKLSGMCLSGVLWTLCHLQVHIYQSYVIHTRPAAKWLLCVQALIASGHPSHTATIMQLFFSLHTERWAMHVSTVAFLTSALYMFLSSAYKYSGWQTDMCPPVCPPLDQWQYEPGARLCVSAGLLAFWQRIGLQTLCLRPHTPHTPHAGGGRGQLLVVCIDFFFLHMSNISVCAHLCTVCFLVIWHSKGTSVYSITFANVAEVPTKL